MCGIDKRHHGKPLFSDAHAGRFWEPRTLYSKKREVDMGRSSFNFLCGTKAIGTLAYRF